MPLDRLPPSLQHLVLLEWLSPESVCAVARAGSSGLRCAVLSAPIPFCAVDETIVADGCVRWFRELGVPLRLWIKVVMRPAQSGPTETHTCNGRIHRDDDLPAVVRADGSREWYQHGKLHRDGDQPAEIHARSREWYQHGVLHRDGDQPAVIQQYGKRQLWYKHGELHRDDDLPAAVYPYGTKEWYQRGVLHRDGDQPAVVWADGYQEWYQHGELHRDGDEPAVIRANGTRRWYQYGRLHREDNHPAVITGTARLTTMSMDVPSSLTR